MGVSEERKRVLDLLAGGKISVDDATTLLKALGPTAAEAYAAPLPPEPPTAASATAVRSAQAAPRSAAGKRGRALRIHIAEVEGGRSKAKVKLNIPLGLAKFALRFVPAQAKEELAAQSIDLNQLLDGISDESPEGPIVDIEATKSDGSGVVERITIEVI